MFGNYLLQTVDFDEETASYDLCLATNCDRRTTSVLHKLHVLTYSTNWWTKLRRLMSVVTWSQHSNPAAMERQKEIANLCCAAVRADKQSPCAHWASVVHAITACCGWYGWIVGGGVKSVHIVQFWTCHKEKWNVSGWLNSRVGFCGEHKLNVLFIDTCLRIVSCIVNWKCAAMGYWKRVACKHCGLGLIMVNT